MGVAHSGRNGTVKAWALYFEKFWTQVLASCPLPSWRGGGTDKSGRLWETFFHEKGEKVQVDLAQIDRAAPEDS